MHVSFIPYGIKNMVDLFLENLNQRILPLRLTKDGKERYINIQCQIRLLPLGVVEFVFPKEYANQVMTALRFNQAPPYNLEKSFLGIKPINWIRKFLKIEKIPKFNEEKGFPLLELPVSIIPLGVRYDGERTMDTGEFKGWTYESL